MMKFKGGMMLRDKPSAPVNRKMIDIDACIINFSDIPEDPDG
jgi:hypothetical protein